MMRTLTCTTPGHLDYNDGVRPTLSPNQTIIKIKQIGICGTDLHAYEGTQPFFNYPRVLGHELSGEIVETDGDLDFYPGEAVTFIPYFHCGYCVACKNDKPNCCTRIKVFGVHIDGGMSEYVSVPTSSLVHGQGLSYDELALIEPLAIGAHAIDRAGVKSTDFVLVMGAGPIGLGAMEFARIAGADVIALDVNTQRLNFCGSKLGISHLIDANSENINEQLAQITQGQMPNVVIDATGNSFAIEKGFTYLAHSGSYILVGLQKKPITFSHPEFHKREATLMSSRNATRKDFLHVIDCIKTGRVSPVNYITHRVEFEQVSKEFGQWLSPQSGVIKAMVVL